MAIDIGADATTRASNWSSGDTIIAKDNPANATGTLTSIEIYAVVALGNCVVGTFYTTNGDTLKCRDSAALGTITAGSKQTITEDSGSNALAIEVSTGDYIGIYYTSGNIYRDTSGFAGLWGKVGEYIDPNDEAEYGVVADHTISLYGAGEALVDVTIIVPLATVDGAGIVPTMSLGRIFSAPLATIDVTGVVTATETLRPDAAGDETNWTPSAGANWECVDEVEADEDTTTNDSTLRVTGAFKICLKENDVVTDGENQANTSSYVTFSQQWNTRPSDSGAWTWADIDALQIGYIDSGGIDGRDLFALPASGGSGTINSVTVYVRAKYVFIVKYELFMTQVYVEVDYTAPPALSLDRIFTVPLATIDSIGLVPVWALHPEISVPLATIAAVGLVPTLSLDRIFAAPLATIDSAGLVPTMSLGIGVIAPLATISATGFVPAFIIDKIFSVPLATVAGAGLVPTLRIDRIFSVPLATISSEGLVPAMRLDRIFVVPLATIEGIGLVPTMGINVPLATISAEGIAPTLYLELLRALIESTNRRTTADFTNLRTMATITNRKVMNVFTNLRRWADHTGIRS